MQDVEEHVFLRSSFLFDKNPNRVYQRMLDSRMAVGNNHTFERVVSPNPFLQKELLSGLFVSIVCAEEFAFKPLKNSSYDFPPFTIAI